ncbi:rCG55687, isoform CRA_a [Rattus norvegicus]|uniref:RCG55687, isoform CRA_a n=1 Tax=Rattus norvegicus TaxID=10116 RepID=A6JR51_RAT|nr:rCG55687, isoform CRA_a [Rattus norvegicus]
MEQATITTENHIQSKYDIIKPSPSVYICKTL